MTAQPHDLGSASLLPTGIKTALSGFVFVVGLAFAAPAALAQTAPYPVISAISDALNRDARIGAAQAQADGARYTINQAKAGRYPTVRSVSDFSGNPFTMDSTQVVGVAVDQPLFDWGKTRAEVQAARRLAEAELALVDATRLDIAEEVTTAYVTLVREKEALNILRRQLSDLQEQVGGLQAQVSAGVATRVDLRKVETEISLTRSEIARGDYQVVRAEQQLQRLTGSGQAASVSQEQLENFYFAFRSSTLEEAQTRAQLNHPEIIAFSRRLAAKQAEVLAAKRGRYPGINLRAQLAGGWRNGSFGDESGLSLNLSAPLYQGNRLFAGQKRVEEELKGLQQEYVFELERLVENVTFGWNNISSLERSVAQLQQQVRQNQSRVSDVEEERRAGLATTGDVIDAKKAWFRSQELVVDEMSRLNEARTMHLLDMGTVQ
ncbi:MAG: TolC family protein [Alphaproteobacteria bacterium]|nr:TolC family protein [Alphaproteobacteria bacterium]